MKKIVLIALLALCGAAAASAQTRFADLAFKQALERAAAEEKLLFVDLYASWCGPCQQMTRAVFPRQEVGDCMNAHYVAVKYDIDKDPDGKELKRRYSVRSIPTYLVFDARGRLVLTFGGAMPADKFRAKMQRIAERKEGVWN
ncbi:thioredoxin fold domain-containing protein [uncultured Alistipes sp.]|uniref:thioredoxin family protein n=1 Tax=uncultured Alistipes sp. TaxID=538949 RepID=UPI0026224D0A|nr:thioredoxin fold domain-containing protein [uncultured Alistipes sp.]